MINSNRIIKLSFDDNSVSITRKSEVTAVSVVSYFRSDKLFKFMNDIGFDSITNVVYNTLAEYGYQYNYKLNGWATKTCGTTRLDERDNDDQTLATRIAMTKAKSKAYSRAIRCLNKIKNKFADAMIMFDDSQLELQEYGVDENDAISRVIQTGSCKAVED